VEENVEEKTEKEEKSADDPQWIPILAKFLYLTSLSIFVWLSRREDCSMNGKIMHPCWNNSVVSNSWSQGCCSL
jgi:hypothetical protein